MSTLAVVGAGPKGIAVAAKARALAAAGFQAPRVVLIDRDQVAGNWDGHQGYTNGLLPLGTPPEKDVGYPNVCVIGSGETAAWVVIDLVTRCHRRSTRAGHGGARAGARAFRTSAAWAC